MLDRRAIVEVRGGPQAFRRSLVTPRQPLRVGRTSLADFVVPDDESLAQLHWEVRWDGERCEIADLGTDGGTFVGGLRIDRAEAKSGAWIRAGGTDFSVFFEDVAPHHPRGPLSVLEPIAARGALFGVLDGARNDKIVRVLQHSCDEYASLYNGLQAEVEADGAPYLVRFDRDSRLLPRLLDEGFRKAWGIFIETKSTFTELRAHLRRLLVVTRERDGEPMHFRFYDPRVLRAFLPIATPRQISLMFGSIDAFFAESREDDSILAFERGQDGLVQRKLGEGARAQDQ